MSKHAFLIGAMTALVALSGGAVSAAPQWHSVTEIHYGHPQKIVQHQDYFYVAEQNGHTLKSKDIETGWEPIMIDEVDNSCYLTSDGTTVYGSKYGSNSYKTTDNFQTITVLSISTEKKDGRCAPLLVQNQVLIVGNNDKILYSEDDAVTFHEATFNFDNSHMNVTGLYQNDAGIIIATTANDYIEEQKGILFSKDGGHSWEQSDAPDTYRYPDYAVTTSGSKFYAAPYYDKGTLLVSENGANWSTVDMAPLPDTASRSVSYSIAVDDHERIYAMVKKGIVISDGGSWKLISRELPEYFGRMTIFNDQLLAMYGGGYVRTYNPDSEHPSWKKLPGTTNVNISTMATSQEAAYVGTGDDTVFYGPVFKKTAISDWTKIYGNTYNGIFDIYADKKGVVMNNRGLCAAIFIDGNEAGFNYTTTPPVIKNCESYETQIASVARFNNIIWAGISLNDTASTIMGTEDSKNWLYRNDQTGNPAKMFTEGKSGAVYNAAGFNQISVTYDGGMSWSKYSKGIAKEDFLNYVFYDQEGNTLYAARGYRNGDIQPSGGLYRLQDGSDTWINVGSNLPEKGRSVYAVTVMDKTVYASIYGYGVYMAKQDDLNDWTPVNTGLYSKKVQGIMSFENAIYVGTEDTGLFKYTP